MLSQAQERWLAVTEQLREDLIRLQGLSLPEKEKVRRALRKVSVVVRQINALDNPYYRPVQQLFFREMFVMVRSGEYDVPKPETLPNIITMVEQACELIIHGSQG